MLFAFLRTAPDELRANTIYISTDHAVAMHLCCCGCGTEVVTPLSPSDWKLIFDGESVSLYPSIGNFNFKCQSHYWIRNNRVLWVGRWSATKSVKERAGEFNERAPVGKGEATVPTGRAPWWRRLLQPRDVQRFGDPMACGR